MEVISADRVLVQTTIAAFREAAAYYMSSEDQTASDARERLKRATQGAEPFFTALYQDLDSIHMSFERLWRSAGSGETKRILHELLGWLAMLIRPKHEQRAACETLPSTNDHSVEALLKLCKRASSWNFDGLGPTQLEYLVRRIRLEDPPSQLREELTRVLEAIIHHIQPSDDRTHREGESAQDSWAHRAAARLCKPLRGVHETVLGEWFCDCPTRHTTVLASFAVPCFTRDTDVHCILRFPSGQSWSTVFLDVKDDFPGRAVPDEVALEDTSDLHEELTLLPEGSVTTARLTFSLTAKRWSLRKEDEHPARQRDMVALADLIALDGTQALREQVSYRHRVSLALLIAYAFLELGDSPWLPYTTDHINIWLPRLTDTTPDVLQPYIEVGLDNSNHILDKEKYRFLRLLNRNMPCLPLLGKLIFELISGDSVDGFEDVLNRLARYDFQFPERAPHVSSAVRSCIIDQDFSQGMITEDEGLREAFLERVIDRLHTLLRCCHGQDLETVIRESQHTITQQSFLVAERIDKVSYKVVQPDGHKSAFVVGGPKTGFCLHDNEIREPYDANKAGKADHFLQKMDGVHEYIRGIGLCRPVKIAIIDTGVHFDARVRNSYCSRLKECRSWLQSTFDPRGTVHPEGIDLDGHGTHCTSTVLKCAPQDCEVYVAQVFAARAESALAFGCPTGTNTRVAQAIEYAVDHWQVDIISMSFGFEARDAAIDAALKKAEDNDVLLMAAASNVGRDMVDARSWPAATRDNVMCIYAAEGRGVPYPENPRWRRDTHRLATLGVMVPVWSTSGDSAVTHITHRSGTSIATPAAAGVAACVLSFVWRSEATYLSNMEAKNGRASERFQDAKKRLLRASGMNEIFKRMADEDDNADYHFVHPWKMFDHNTSVATLIENIVNHLT